MGLINDLFFGRKSQDEQIAEVTQRAASARAQNTRDNWAREVARNGHSDRSQGLWRAHERAQREAVEQSRGNAPKGWRW